MSLSRATHGVVVAAGGRGTRLGAPGPKQYVPLLGVPMLRRTVSVLDSSPLVDAIVVVVNEEDVEFCRREILADSFPKVRTVVGGGEERALSVRAGVWVLAEEGLPEVVSVHDGARPLLAHREIEAGLERLSADGRWDGVVIAVPATDTVKLVDAEGAVRETLDRARVWRAQTPQIFRGPVILSAYSQEEEVLLAATDDAALVERAGGCVGVVEGARENFKVTTPEDVHWAEHILRERESP